MAKPLTKSQFVSLLAEHNGQSKKEAADLWEFLVSTVYKHVKADGEITLPGLGKLQLKNRAARMGRNPATGEQIQIPAKTVLKFRVAKAAKDEIL